jgi:hypothetical protein
VTSTGSVTRDVARCVTHPEPLSFRELCERVVPPDARFVVLDLDRTVHFGLNLGELLGWELAAAQAYGIETLRSLEASRGRRRLVLDPRHPVSLARFVGTGLLRWTSPGLHYFLWGKQASSIAWLRRAARRRYGESFMQHAQRGAQLTLMRQLADAEPRLLDELAQRVWKRHAKDQVITRADVQWLRTSWPGVEVILTSASPQVMVETAARELGVDFAVFSTPERINSGREKVARLRELRPALLDPANVSVGITDTQYGEDHCWAEHFTIVVDINSEWPFPRRVPDSAPLREVHSAWVLTRAELARRRRGQPGHLDPRRMRGAGRRRATAGGSDRIGSRGLTTSRT